MAIVELYRALSGSQYVYWNSSQVEPASISNKVIVGELITVDTVDTASIVALAVTSGSDVLFKWNGNMNRRDHHMRKYRPCLAYKYW